MRFLLVELHNESSEFLQKLLIDEYYALLWKNDETFFNVLKDELELIFFLFFFNYVLDLIVIKLLKNVEPCKNDCNGDEWSKD